LYRILAIRRIRVTRLIRVQVRSGPDLISIYVTGCMKSGNVYNSKFYPKSENVLVSW